MYEPIGARFSHMKWTGHDNMMIYDFPVCIIYKINHKNEYVHLSLIIISNK